MVQCAFIMYQSLLLIATHGKATSEQITKSSHCDSIDDPSLCEAMNADSMLQAGRTTRKIIIDQGSPSPNPAGTVNWDGFDTFELSREEVNGFPAEIYYTVSRNQFGTMEGNRVFVPYDHIIKAIFVRDMHGIGSNEYGMATWNWQRNHMSVLWNNVTVGAGEKLHTFVHDGPWESHTLDRVQAIQEDRWDTTQMLAEASRDTRSAAVNTWTILNKIGTQLGNASIDPGVFHDIEAFALESDQTSPSAFDLRMEAVGANLTQKHETYINGLNGAWPSSSSTSLNCLHLTNSSGLELTSDGFWWPLNKKIPSFRGQVVFAPIQRFDIMSGNTIMKYNETDQTFRIYMGAAMLSNVVDPYVSSGAFRHQPKLFVGPADGANRPIPPEGRHRPPPYAMHTAAIVWSLHQTFSQIPADYTFLFQSEEEACPPDALARAKTELGSLDLMAMTSGGASLQEKMRAINVMTGVLDCSMDYLRADVENSHSFGPFQSMVFLHALIEFGFASMERGWNTISADIFCPASGCIATTTTTTTTEGNWWNFWR